MAVITYIEAAYGWFVTCDPKILSEGLKSLFGDGHGVGSSACFFLTLTPLLPAAGIVAKNEK